MSLDLNDLVQRTIFFNKKWEPLLSDYLEENISSHDVFYDIGCNVGYYSLLAASKNCNVISIDPDPYNIMILKENISINRLPKINYYEFGLDACNAVKPFYRASISNNGLSGFTSRNTIASFETNVYSLNYLVEHFKFPIPTIIKLDTEGWEQNILEGASAILRDTPPRIIIFESDTNNENALNNLSSIENLLKIYGYKIMKELRDELGINFVATLTI